MGNIEGRLLMFLFGIIFLMTSVNAVLIDNQNIPIVRPQVVTIQGSSINNNTISVNNSLYWQGHTGTDGSWLTGINTYNLTYDSKVSFNNTNIAYLNNSQNFTNKNNFKDITANRTEVISDYLGNEILQNGNFLATGNVSAVIDPSADTIRRYDLQSTEVYNGDRIHFSGTLPAELSSTILYYVVSRTASNFKVSTTLGGGAIDITTAGTSVVYSTEWQVTNDATYDLTNKHIDFVYSSGLSSNLTQYTRLRNLVTPQAYYTFNYTVSNSANSPTAILTSSFAFSNIALDLSNGNHAILFMSSSTPENFVISSTLTSGQTFTLSNLSLKKNDGDIVTNGEIGAGVLDPLYPLDVSGAIHVRNARIPSLTANATNLQSFIIEAKADPSNPSSTALFIYPTFGGRMYFGDARSSSTKIDRINFGGVTTGFEGFPYFVYSNGGNDNFYSVKNTFNFATNLPNIDISFMPGLDQPFESAGYLTGGQKDANVNTQIKWRSHVADNDTKATIAGYSYDTYYRLVNKFHSVWQNNRTNIMSLTANGDLTLAGNLSASNVCYSNGSNCGGIIGSDVVFRSIQTNIINSSSNITTPATNPYTGNNNLTFTSLTNLTLVTQSATVNYTVYDKTIVGLFNLNNYSALGENATYFADISLFSNNATCGSTACPNYNSNGKYFGAYRFDGVNDVVKATRLDAFANGKMNLSFGCWINFTASQTNKEIMGWWYNSDVRLYTDAGYVKLGVSGGSLSSISILNDSNWHHIFMVKNASNLVLYIDGVQNAKSNHATALANTDGFALGAYAQASPGTATGSFFNGTIDDAIVINRSLSATEVSTLYAGSLSKYNSTYWNYQSSVSNAMLCWTDNGVFNCNDLPSTTYYVGSINFSTNSSGYTDFKVSNNWNPLTNNLYTLGNNVLRWAKGFFVDLDVSNNVNIDNNLNVSGNITGSQIYGQMWFHNDTVANTTVIASAGVYYNISAFDSQKSRNVTTNGFSNNSNALIAQVSGLYQASLSISANGAINDIYNIPITINGIEQEGCEPHIRIGVATDIVSASANCLIRLNVNDLVYVQVKDETSGGNLDIKAINLNLWRIGN